MFKGVTDNHNYLFEDFIIQLYSFLQLENNSLKTLRKDYPVSREILKLTESLILWEHSADNFNHSDWFLL